MAKVLIVEDDIDIAELERDYLELNGFVVEIATDGTAGLERALTGDFDLLLLDVMLPGVTGFEICRRVREGSEVPILLVTARKEDIDKIRGLGMGADDYIVKPFSPSELVARVRAHLNRYERLKRAAAAAVVAASASVDVTAASATTTSGAGQESAERELTHGELRLLPAEHRVFSGAYELHLPLKEFELLEYFLTHPHQVLSKEELFTAVWGENAIGDISTVTVHIKRLREKIEPDTGSPQHIETVWGAGYRLKAE